MADPLMDDDERPRRRIKQMEVMVAEVIPETPDTTTLLLFTGNDTLDYEPGHFLTIDPHTIPALERFVAYLEDVKGRKEPPRAYSLASSPHEHHLAVTVKEERYISGVTKYPPILSPLLVHRTVPGTKLVVTGFTGPYTLPPDIEQQTDHLLHICAGSGFVPNWSIIKYSLAAEMRLRHTVLCCNKTWDDMIFRRPLQQLADKHPDKLRVVHSLTRDKRPLDGLDVRQGRVGRDLIQELLPDDGSAHVYVCGPGISVYERRAAKAAGQKPQPRFLESVLAALAELGVDNSRVHHESYG